MDHSLPIPKTNQSEIIDLSDDESEEQVVNKRSTTSATPKNRSTFVYNADDSEDDSDDIEPSPTVIDLTNDCPPTPPTSPASKKRAAPSMTKESENDSTSKSIKLSTPSSNSAIIDYHMKMKEDRDAMQYKIFKAKRDLRRDEKIMEQRNETLKQILRHDLDNIWAEKERWEAMMDYEVKATEQRLQELKEKRKDLAKFGDVLNHFEKTDSGEGEVLACMEACKPVV